MPLTALPLATTMPARSRPRTTGGVRPKKLSSASLYSRGFRDEAATRISTWSGAAELEHAPLPGGAQPDLSCTQRQRMSPESSLIVPCSLPSLDQAVQRLSAPARRSGRINSRAKPRISPVGIGTPLDDESPEMASTKKGHLMRTPPDDAGLDRKGRREHLTHPQRSHHPQRVGASVPLASTPPRSAGSVAEE